MQKQKITFLNKDGIPLSGLLESPEHPKAYALFAHCFTCGKDLISASQISRALVEKGIATLRFDFTGLGGSEGEFANSNFSSNVDDLLAAARYLGAHFRAPELLVGHSLGGTAVLIAALQLESVKCVATIGTPAEPAHILKQFASQVDTLCEKGEVHVSLAGREFTLKKQFIEDVSHFHVRAQLHTLNKALLILHSPRDATVLIDQAERLYTGARHPKSFISLDNADHLLSRKEDARYAAECIACWAERYLPVTASAAPPQSSERQPGEGEVVVSTGKGDFQCEVRTMAHRWLADEPMDVGGNNSGPTPYDQLLAALGACTSMTLRMYARRKQWPLERLIITLKHSRRHLEDCVDCLDGKSIADHIQCDIQVSGALSEEEKARLLEIASLCPVHKTLHNHISVTTRLAEE
ncbi:bifunctional alpha/beta hydrolase/OsmC family protein [Klebsiella aerogenes]